MLPARASDSDSSSGQTHCMSPLRLARAFSESRLRAGDSDRELIDTQWGHPQARCRPVAPPGPARLPVKQPVSLKFMIERPIIAIKLQNVI